MLYEMLLLSKTHHQNVFSDTKLTAKSLVSEVTSHAPTLCKSPQGRRALFYLLVPRSPKYFTPAQIAILAETDAIRAQTSKKQADVRAKELCQAASEDLISFVEKMGSLLVKDPGGSLVVSEVMLHAEGGVKVFPFYLESN
jgi:pumilio homology domain family member 6